MSTPEQPATPALTRRQMRDIRNTGATPIISDDAPADDLDGPAEDEASGDRSPERADEQPDSTEDDATDADAIDDARPDEPVPAPVAHPAPLPRAAVPALIHDLPGADASVDLGVSPLTRRQARQQERIRTASVPVITPEVAAAHVASQAAVEDSRPATDQHDSVDAEIVEEPSADADASDFGPVAAVGAHDVADQGVGEWGPAVDAAPEDEPIDLEQLVSGSDDLDRTEADESERAVVNPQFGAELLAGEIAQVELPPSFDQLITRSTSGATGTGNALILSQAPSEAPLVAPVTATGEVLITGSFNLPEGLGSTGHAAGTADGKEVDAVLVDGELPAHSSPTPIAASAAISTVKNGGDIIKPPAPEKGGRLMLTLAITAGVLALALVGVLILAFVTGVF